MAETITLLGKMVEAFPIGSPVKPWWRVNCAFFYAEVLGDGSWELGWNEEEQLDGIADTPQAAADAIEAALRELVRPGGEWNEAMGLLIGLYLKEGGEVPCSQCGSDDRAVVICGACDNDE